MAKKIKPIETPIDKRETFISIQRNFADSDMSVEEKLKILYDLQKADTDIDKIILERGELPMEVENLEAEVAKLKQEVESVANQIEEFNNSISDKKHKIFEYENQIAKYQNLLENITNSREYDSLNKEIENLNLERDIADKYIGEKTELIKEKEDELEDLKKLVGIRLDDLAAKKEELAVIVESTAKVEEKLRARREECAAKIDARTMSAYERIRMSNNNRLAVVAVFNGDSCGGCFSTIVPQRLIDIASNKKLIICEHCGRILVNADFE